MPSRYVATSQGGPWEIVEAPKPTPGANEVVINVKAVGLCPLDWKQQFVTLSPIPLRCPFLPVFLAHHDQFFGAFRIVHFVVLSIASRSILCTLYDSSF
jgi:hypothetical protein